MEGKIIIYIIAGVLYFLYTIGKKVQEKQKANPPVAEVPPVKPISPPDYNRDAEKRKAELDAKKNKPVQVAKAGRPELQLVNLKQEVKKKSYYEVQASEEAARLLAEKKQPVIAAAAPPEVENDVPYEFDARQAFIGSVIFERKY